MEGLLITFSNDNELQGPIYTLSNRADIQRDLDRLVELASRIFMIFDVNKYKVLHLE